MLFLVWNYSYQHGSWLLGPESGCSTLLRNVGIYSPSDRAWYPWRSESSIFLLTRLLLAVMWWRKECRSTPPTAQNVSKGPPSRPWRSHMTSQGSRHFLAPRHFTCINDVRHLIFRALFPCVRHTNHTYKLRYLILHLLLRSDMTFHTLFAGLSRILKALNVPGQ
jgi:hypothetical protein